MTAVRDSGRPFVVDGGRPATWHNGFVGEIFGELMELMERAGKPGALVSVVLGLVLMPVGVYLFLYGAGPDHYWPIMLGISGLGFPLVLLGLAPFIGNQARLDAVMEGDTAAPRASRAKSREALAAMKAPFGSCSDCGHVAKVEADPDRCPACFSLSGWVYAADESGRARVESNLG